MQQQSTKVNIVVHTTELDNKHQIKQILSHYNNYYDGHEQTMVKNQLTGEIEQISHREYYYGVSREDALAIVRLLNQSRNRVITQVRIVPEDIGNVYFD